MDDKSISILLVEYNAAQDSIAHYEKLIWTVGSISNALVVVVISQFVKLNQPNTILFAATLSLVLHGLWWAFEHRYRQINISKFRRLWEIEESLGMRHHLRVKNDDKERTKLRADLIIASICIFFPVSLIILYFLAEYHLLDVVNQEIGISLPLGNSSIQVSNSLSY